VVAEVVTLPEGVYAPVAVTTAVELLICPTGV